MTEIEALSTMVDLGSMYTLRWCSSYKTWYVELWNGWSPDIVQTTRVLAEWKSEDLGEAVAAAWKAKKKQKGGEERRILMPARQRNIKRLSNEAERRLGVEGNIEFIDCLFEVTVSGDCNVYTGRTEEQAIQAALKARGKL